MEILHFIAYLIFLLIIAILFFSNKKIQTLLNKKNLDTQIDTYYFVNYNNLYNKNTNKIFIHVPEHINSSQWINFGSRNSSNLNNNLAFFSILSVIQHCSNYYDIILFKNSDIKEMIGLYEDDDSLANINNPELLSGIDLKQWEECMKAKILKHYGGVVMKPCFCFKRCPLKSELFPKKLTILNHNNNGLNVSNKQLIPSSNYIIASEKNDSNLNIYINYLEHLCQNFYSNDHKLFDKTFEKLYALNSYDSKYFGITDYNNEIIYPEDLLSSEKEIILDNNNYALFINTDFYDKYTKYGWVSRLNNEQIKNSNFYLANYISIHLNI